MFLKHSVPGWNHLVRDYHLHQAARESFLIWRAVGSPRRGPLYDLMKIKQAQFKRNKTEKNTESLKAKGLASNLSSRDFKKLLGRHKTSK